MHLALACEKKGSILKFLVRASGSAFADEILGESSALMPGLNDRKYDVLLQVAGSIIGKGGQNITKLRSQVSLLLVSFVDYLLFRRPVLPASSSLLAEGKHEGRKRARNGWDVRPRRT